MLDARFGVTIGMLPWSLANRIMSLMSNPALVLSFFVSWARGWEIPR